METKETSKNLHARNIHNQLYDFDTLVKFVPKLESHIILNPSNQKTIQYSNPEAVKLLNKAILLAYYQLEYWDLPKNQLCPPIPGRADYIHYLADLLAENSKISNKRILDIGVGANLIYPIIGVSTYNWSFVGSDCNAKSLENASEIILKNPNLINNIELRFQPNNKNLLKNIIKENELFDAVICNPPFFKSKEEALSQTNRKVKNLKIDTKKGLNNFGGLDNELWYKGGELNFVSKLIVESSDFKNQVSWFTSLISNKDNLKPLQLLVKKNGATNIKIIDMEQGNKKSRFLAWKY